MLVSEDERKKIRPEAIESLPHPIYCMASAWRVSELNVLLSHCNYRYPLKDENVYVIGKDGISLAASFHYPLHTSLISLRNRLSKLRETGSVDGFDDTSSEPPLARTIAVLLDYGFEPNERIESIDPFGDISSEINKMVGFTPLQILAAAVLDWKDLSEFAANDDAKKLSKTVVDRFKFYIETVAELLIRKGARITLESPPLSRPGRKICSPELPSESIPNSLHRSVRLSTCQSIERSLMKIDKNSYVIEFFGGEEKIKNIAKSWLRTSNRSVKGLGKILLHSNKSAISDSFSPGGSDTRSCAICWKSFGLVKNRKHLCRATARYVCEECSGRCVLERGEAFRVSDGQFSLAKVDLRKYLDFQDEKRKTQRKERLENANKTSATKRDENNSLKEEIFGRVGKSVRNYFLEEVETDNEINNNQTESLNSTLRQTQDAFHERGDKLNNLSEKTNALKDASTDFAKMAKELNEQQQGGFFW